MKIQWNLYPTKQNPANETQPNFYNNGLPEITKNLPKTDKFLPQNSIIDRKLYTVTESP
jgi:hypothetical protein